MSRREFLPARELAPEFIALLRCPCTGQALRMASAELLARLTPPLASGLITDDERIIYPLRNGIPVLIAEEAIHLPPAGSALPGADF